jgi:hypothetical protein
MQALYYDIHPYRFTPQLNGDAGQAVTKSAVKGATAAGTIIASAGTVATAATAVGAGSIAAGAAAIGSVVPVVGTAIGLVIGATIGLIIAKTGGVTQDRFFDRYFEVKDILNKAGYTYPDHDKLITDLKIRKTQVVDRKKSGSYAPEFARLMKYVIMRLNKNNPGLGDYWGANFPMSMANKGNIKGESVAKLKELVRLFPPGTYRGQQPFAADADGKLLKQITSTGKTTTNVDGEKVIENIPRDPNGNPVLPAETYKEAEAMQAGIDPVLGIGLGILIIGGMMMAGNDKKKVA